MKRCIKKGLFVGSLLLAGACSQKSQSAGPKVVGQHFTDGKLIVAAKNIQAVLAQNPDLKAEPIFPEINLYVVKGPTLKGHELDMAKAWMDGGLVDAADPSFIRSIATRDPYWIDLWGLKNIGQDAPHGTEGLEGADIKVEEAWKKTTGDKKIIVGVMDTGIDYKHPDLRDNIWINQKEFNGENGKDNDGNGYVNDVYGYRFDSVYDEKLDHGQIGSHDPMDGNGHGTHVSGTIGAVADNGIGVAGINQHVSLMAIKVLSDEGSGEDADIIRGLRYATIMKVDVVNASFGGGGYSPTFKAALKAFGDAGGLFVAAAGNDASDNDPQDKASYPANYRLENVISVAATDNRDQLAEFSNYGYQKVDIAAPGVNVVSTYPTALAANEGTPLDPYRVFSGTSMATPHVTGAAALVLAGNPDLYKHPAALKERLVQSADWLPQLAGRVHSGGRLNVANAVNGVVTNLLDEKAWIADADFQPLSSTTKPIDQIDQQLVIHKDGAKAIRAHLKSSLIDSIDLAALYDSSLRLISFLPSDTDDYWTPAVYGKEMTLRFANALVTVQKVKTKIVTDDPSSLDEQNATCFPDQKDAEKFDCTIYDKPSDPFGNFRSEGFTVDKVEYIKADEVRGG